MVASREDRLTRKLGFHLTVSRAMLGALELDQILHVILAGVTHPEGLGFDRVYLFLADERRHKLLVSHVVGPSDEQQAGTKPDLENLLGTYDAVRAASEALPPVRRLMGVEVPVSASAPPLGEADDEVPVHALVARCAAERKPFFSNSMQAFYQPPTASGSEVLRLSHMASVPLLMRNDVLGVLLADNTFSQRKVGEDEVKGLATLGNLAAVSIENARLNRRLEESTLRDGLTGVFNRRHYEGRLEKEVQRARQDDRSLGILVFHVLDFKTINDTHGCASGDQVLQELAEFLRRGVRAEDMIARYGQEEFIVLLTGGATKDETMTVAEKLIGQVGTRQFAGLQAGQTQIGVGVAWLPSQRLDREVLSRMVDEVLGRIRSGSDGVALAEES